MTRPALGAMLGFFLIVGACADASGAGPAASQPTQPPSTGEEPESTTIPPAEVPPSTTIVSPSQVPDVDLTRHSVPLEEVYFDTFDGGALRLSDSNAQARRRLRDVIPPIDNPAYEPATAADWLRDGDLVIGYKGGDQAYSYPIRILNFHEIVNDQIDGIPVLISYCPLCRSGVVFDRRVDGMTLDFGNTSALYESDLVMYDRSTGSYWWQVAGRAIVGTLTDSTLLPLPSRTTTWGEWKESHPETLVLSRDTGFERDYDRDPFVGLGEFLDAGNFPFPVSEAGRDGRLAPSEVVLGLEVDGVNRVYPLGVLGSAAINDTLGDQEVVVFTTQQGPAGSAFSRAVDDRILTFNFTEDTYRDETGTVWNLDGEAIEGPLSGRELEPLPTTTAFWFSYIAAFPDTEIYVP